MPAFLGLLMLDTRFPRLPGDAGLAASWPMPVRLAVVRGATPQRVVRQADATLLPAFISAARALVDAGAAAITTSCGFLVQFQAELQAALPVPVWTSALLACPKLPQPGVITVDAQALGPAHLRAAGASPATPVQGLPHGGHLQTTLLHNRPTLDAALARAEVVQAARALLQRCPQLQHLVLECTNLPPHADAVAQATGLPVHHLLTLVCKRWKAL